MTERLVLDELLEVIRWRWLTIAVLARSVTGGAAVEAQLLPTFDVA